MTQLPFSTPRFPLDDTLSELVDDYGFETVVVALRRLTPTDQVPSAPARPGDPVTSHLAAKREQDVGRFSEKSRQAKLLRLFSMRDMTDQQATIALVGSYAAPSAFDGCRRRCSDLRAVNYLYDTGRKAKNQGSEELSIIWAISNAGLVALTSLDDTGWSREPS